VSDEEMRTILARVRKEKPQKKLKHNKNTPHTTEERDQFLSKLMP